jgi:hypothetical protein
MLEDAIVMGSKMKDTEAERENRSARIPKAIETSRDEGQSRSFRGLLRNGLKFFFVLGILALIAIAIDLCLPRETTYSLNIVTQVLEITVSDLKGMTAILPDVRVIGAAAHQDEINKTELTNRRVILIVRDKTRLILERKTEGDLLIRFSNKDADPGIVRLNDAEGSQVPFRSGDSVRVIFDGDASSSKDKKSPETLILPLQGKVQVGRPVAPMREHILLEGKVSVFEKDPFLGMRYLARESLLEPGDVVNWNSAVNENVDNLVRGFAHIGIGQGIRLIANTNAAELEVVRFGASPYGLSPSLWDRIGRDPVLGGMLGILAFLGGLITVFEVLYVTLANSKHHG